MKTKTKFLIVSALASVLAILTNTVGPLGGFWRPTTESADPTNLQYIFLGILLFIEAIAFGLGIGFLFFGYPLIQNVSRASETLNRFTHVAIGWLLINWWAHDSLHLHVGMNRLWDLILIEYAFHFTIIVSGITIIAFLLVQLRKRKELTAT